MKQFPKDYVIVTEQKISLTDAELLKLVQTRMNTNYLDNYCINEEGQLLRKQRVDRDGYDWVVITDPLPHIYDKVKVRQLVLAQLEWFMEKD